MPKNPKADKHLAAGRAAGRRRSATSVPQSAAGALEALLRRQPQWMNKAAQAAENRELVDVLRERLPAALAAHARSAALERAELVVTADAAVWCGRLRYELAALLPELQRQWPGVRTIRLKVGTGR